VSALKSLYGRGIHYVNNKGILDAKLLPKELLGNLMLFQLFKRIAHLSRPAAQPRRVRIVTVVSKLQ
jgi:hypothetical protein